jgi:hypothetical protein
VTTINISCAPGTINMHDGSMFESGVEPELTGSESDPSCLQKIIRGPVLKLRFPVGKMHRNVIQNYLKPVARMRYRIRSLQDESKRLVLVGLRQRICTTQFGHTFLKLSTQTLLPISRAPSSPSCCMTMLVVREGSYLKKKTGFQLYWYFSSPV